MTGARIQPLCEGDGQPWRRSVCAPRDERYQVVFRRALLSHDNPMLANTLRRNAPALIVTTPSVERLYGEALKRYLAANCSEMDISFAVLRCSEASKDIEQVLAVCRSAAMASLGRRSQIVCFGGGVALDICGLAATLFRRGICSIRVPTTLIGMVDAGIGVKNGINFEGAKSLLGSFAAGEACLIDPTFLGTLPRRHLRCGLAECVKVAIISSPQLFDLLDFTAEGLLDEGRLTLPGAIDAVIRLTAEWTLDELELNLFERKELFPKAYTRKLDFGHTFSPHIEAASKHGLLHGEAVAIDMAMSAEIACRLGMLDEATRTRIFDLLDRFGLPTHWPPLDPEALHASLKSVVLHRDGMLNLVVPLGIGEVAFIERLEEVSLDLIREVVRRGAKEASRWQTA